MCCIVPERTRMNNDLIYQGSDLMLDRLPLATIAREYGTPVYVYSASSIRGQVTRLMQSLGTIGSLRYAVKANANPALLALIFNMGLGADTVSRGEIQAALDASCPADRIVFSGVGKTQEELAFALDHGVFINAESEEELAAIARLQTGAHVGIPIDAAPDAFRGAMDAGLVPDTISCHIGSQITSLEPYRKALARLLELRDSLMGDGIPVSGLDMGGGFGINYGEGTDFAVEDLQALLRRDVPQGMKLWFEPGRYIVGHAGTLVTRVLYRKRYARTFVVVDAGMNDLIRPALYQAHHAILPVTRRDSKPTPCDIVGPVCESADCFARDVPIPLPEQGDLLAICDTGAYGWSMSSTYNGRPLLPEVLIEDGEPVLIRERGL